MRANADLKTPIDNLPFAERRQPPQTQSYILGGGGARAARRIQIKLMLLTPSEYDKTFSLCEKIHISWFKVDIGPKIYILVPQNFKTVYFFFGQDRILRSRPNSSDRSRQIQQKHPPELFSFDAA